MRWTIWRSFPRAVVVLIALPLLGVLGPVIGPVAAAAPTLTLTDHDLTWGARERHFPQNKQAESPMATNPTDSRNSISGSEDFVQEPDCQTAPRTGGSICLPAQTINTIGVYTTRDGGLTWAKQILDFRPIGRLANADPTIAFGPKPDALGGFSYAHGARAYVSAMAFPLGNVSPFAEPVVVVASSDDEGITWTHPVIATPFTANPRNEFNDKPTIWADTNPSSPAFGNLYLIWALETGVGPSGSTYFCTTCPFQILLARSTDGGQSWSRPVALTRKSNSARNGYPEEPFVRTDREGRVLALWQAHIGATARQSAIVSAVSTDGGAHFGRAVMVGPTFDRNPLPGTSFPNLNPPAVDVDPSTDAIYVTWADVHPIDSRRSHGVVTVMKSTDHGQSWGKTATLDVPGRSAFHPAVAVARSGVAPPARRQPGRVVIGFTALRDVPTAASPLTGATDFLPYLAISDDGGTSWSAPTIPTGAGLSDPAAAAGFLNDLGSEFVGDYASASAAPDGTTFFFSYTSTQEGTGCAVVDAYRVGRGPLPNLYASCAPTFGNVDVHVVLVRGTP